MTVAAALFDLDDTLYREMDFVESGFMAVAGFLSEHYGFNEEIIFDKTMDILRAFGRGKIFDRLLNALDISDEAMVHYLVYIYRTHRPDIHTYEEAIPVLKGLRAAGVKTGLITDGMAVVQQNKVAALGIYGLFDVVIYTDAIGRPYWKPSPVPFKMALQILGTTARESVYVGDDPLKDFHAPNALGMKSVQIIREGAIARDAGQGYAAQTIINTLSEYFGVTYGYAINNDK
ncbi:MAG: HAD hydrolase-like protein [Nitrospirae bacterium]|nr:HAD hydrolase-like protein [Nitrospirota bacterium]